MTDRKSIVDQFHHLYYHAGLESGQTWSETNWLGVPIYKCPLDLMVYQEIIYGIRPDLIIECGTADGGGALFLASMCDLINHGRVVTIDYLAEYKKCKYKGERPQHKRITYLLGSSISDDTVRQVRSLISENDKVLVMLDSHHSKEHVLAELKAYSGFVTSGSYLIVEDTNINGHPVWPDYGPGPMEAVDDFLKENKDFTIDEKREKYLLTFNPRGYLRRR